ncbi:MAG: hypothetical protein IJI01_02545 [Butyrivibrio sp.]|uniref:asparagine synthase-related protein n=1 Tax=Butyrivibrio sp. TaxID=28121 RepID=UPI0025BA9629|nr:asparagine synthase-related protein [Butyrivibrio sp.]MBQ6587540.1 hypothetical protein [Butyrivibrio sp.]
MSAIWGFIKLKGDLGKSIEQLKEKSSFMKKPYEECVIDRFEDCFFENGFFSCGIQYFNKRAAGELLPLYDKESDTVFTADIVLNGRPELIDELQGLGHVGLNADTPDGELAYLAWKTWHCDFVDHIHGLFAIAVYDRRSNEFYLFTDHMGVRCVDYSICGDELYFSTLTKPILAAMPEECRGLDEKFMVGSQASSSPYMYVFPDRTPFEYIRHTLRGNYIKITGDNSWHSKEYEYFNPGKNVSDRPQIKWPDNPEDKIYREKFREVFFRCVEDAIDTDGEIAAMISSGLDSSSVATVAARKLASEGKKLYGFTSIPLKDFERPTGGFEKPDESEGVKRIIAGYPNIVQEFCSCEGLSPFTEMDRFIHMYEVPGKACLNQVWFDYIIRSAAAKGCKVLLNGQFGNFTISKGDMKELFFQKLLSGNVLGAKEQLARFGERYGIPRKVLFDGIVSTLIERIAFSVGGECSFKYILDKKYVRQELVRKYKVKRLLKKRFTFYGPNSVIPIKKMFRNLGDVSITQTQGLYDTRFSLYHGVLLRDPTRDKRIVEFIASLPPEQFVYNGLERRLVREYLDDYLPDYDRLQTRYKGRQSADKVMRCRGFGDNHKELELVDSISDYMDDQKVKELMREEITEENVMDIVRVSALNAFLLEYT